MNLCFVTNSTLSMAFEERLESLVNGGVIVFCSGLGLVSYKKELCGETEHFHDIARLSRQTSSVVISGCDTDTYGVFRHSAVIADKGKILGVTDMAHSIDDGEFVSGGNFRVYDTSLGKIGLIIQEDLFFPESARVLTLCDADLIVCLYKNIEDHVPLTMLRAGAFANGVAMALCSKNYACIADIGGNVAFSGNGDIINAKIKIKKDYHLVSSRRRGLYREFNSGY